MKIELKKLPHSRVELTIKLLPEELESYLDEAARELSRTVEIKGFRPGQTPRRIIEERLGKDRVRHRGEELAMRRSYVKAAVEEGLEAINEPAFSTVTPPGNEEFVFRAEVTVLPEVKLGDYQDIPVPAEAVNITEAEVENALKTLQKSRANYTTVSRPAQAGDRIEIDFEITVEGKAIEGGKSSQHPLIIGEGHFMKGFEEELIGMKEGERKTFSLAAPNDYLRGELAGKKVDFSVRMNLVESVELPKVDDELARAVGRFSSLDELKKNINEGLLTEKESRQKEKMRLKIMDVLIERSWLELPETLVEAELTKMEGEFVVALQRLGIDKESYLAHLRKTLAELRREWTNQAAKRVKAALILREIANREKIAVSEEEVAGRINELLQNLPDPAEAQKLDLAALQNYVRGVLRNEKVFALLESRINLE